MVIGLPGPHPGGRARPLLSRSIVHRRLTVLLACLLGLLAACNGPANASPKGDDTAAVYSAIIGKLVADSPPTTTTTIDRTTATTGGDGASTTEAPAEELPTVFIEPLGDGYLIDLGVQAKVVKNLEAVAQVRFIDDRMEAVEAEEPGQPVRPNGMLVALGPLVQANDVERTVQVRRYLDEDNHRDSIATVTASGETWSVVLAEAR